MAAQHSARTTSRPSAGGNEEDCLGVEQIKAGQPHKSALKLERPGFSLQ